MAGLPFHPISSITNASGFGSLTGQPIEAWRFRRENEVVEVPTKGRLMVDEFGTMLGASLEGVGIVRVKAIGVRHPIEQGALVELMPDWLGDSFPLYALSVAPSACGKVRAFIDFVQSRLVPVDDTAEHRRLRFGDLGGCS